MKRIPKYSLLAVALGVLSFGVSPPVRATVPCPIGTEVSTLTIESVTVDGAMQTDLSAYRSYQLQLEAVAYTNGPLQLQAWSGSIYVTEEYSDAR